MHEVRAQIVLVGELVGATLHTHLLDLLAYRRESVLEHAAVFEILELRTHECGAFARFAVLEIDYKESLAIHLDAHADFDISSSDCHNEICFFVKIRKWRKYSKKSANGCTAPFLFVGSPLKFIMLPLHAEVLHGAVDHRGRQIVDGTRVRVE